MKLFKIELDNVGYDDYDSCEKEIDKLKLKNPMNQGERNNI